MIRRHGVSGGPRPSKPIRPREGTRPNINKLEVVNLDLQPEVVIVSTVQEPETKKLESPQVNDFDLVQEADKIEEYVPDDLFPVDEFICDICGFVSKSERGLKSHKRWKHSIIEGV